MWKLRFLGKISILNKIVKAIFNRIYANGREVTIRFGPLSNYTWVCNENHQWWMPLGMYERETADWLVNSIEAGDVFFDVGANAGYFSLLGSKCVGKHGKVISFEPIPSNCESIEKQLAANNINNVALESVAISKDTGDVSFVIEANNPNSHMKDVAISHAISDAVETIQVKSISLDDFVSSTGVTPTILKVDVEGAEKLVLEGSTKLLQDSYAKWIISTHSSTLYDECKSIMQQNGYEVESLVGFHHELICMKTRKDMQT